MAEVFISDPPWDQPNRTSTVTVKEAATPTDPYGGLEGEDRDAYLAITNILKSYGLESLSSAVLGFIQQGYSSETVNILLQETPEYKKRFAANDARRKAGLPVLSPAEYLATERSYRQVMSAAGLPPGFYDEPTDFQSWLEGDVSPVEVQERVDVARQIVNGIDENTKATWRDWYTEGDAVAFVLDPKRAVDVVERQWRAAQIGGVARDQGLSVTSAFAERAAQAGISQEQARQGMSAVKQITQNTSRLSQIYGGNYTQDEALGEVFFADADAAQRRRTLASRERATFEGGSGVNQQSLSRRRAGQV